MRNNRLLQWSLAGVLGLSLLPMAANAQIVQEVLVGQPAPTVTLPANRVDAGQHILFRVINPGAGVANFTVPELGINHPVAGASERTFFVDMSNVMDRQIAYGIQGPGGTQLASGTIINEDYLLPEATSLALARIINYSTAYSAPIDPEPLYRERPVALPQPPSRRVIRGFW